MSNVIESAFFFCLHLEVLQENLGDFRKHGNHHHDTEPMVRKYQGQWNNAIMVRLRLVSHKRHTSVQKHKAHFAIYFQKCVISIFRECCLITNFLFPVKYKKNNDVLGLQSVLPAIRYYSRARHNKNCV